MKRRLCGESSLGSLLSGATSANTSTLSKHKRRVSRRVFAEIWGLEQRDVRRSPRSCKNSTNTSGSGVSSCTSRSCVRFVCLVAFWLISHPSGRVRRSVPAPRGEPVGSIALLSALPKTGSPSLDACSGDRRVCAFHHLQRTTRAWVALKPWVQRGKRPFHLSPPQWKLFSVHP